MKTRLTFSLLAALLFIAACVVFSLTLDPQTGRARFPSLQTLYNWSGFAPDIDETKLICRDGLAHDSRTDKPVAGVVVQLRDEDYLRRTSYKDGWRHGVEMWWYPDGRRHVLAHWEDGLKHGPEEVYFNSGQLQNRTTYKAGKQDSLAEQFNEFGMLLTAATYKEGTVMACEGPGCCVGDLCVP